MTDLSNETFEEFKNSFSYGSRNDLSFKFLKGLSTEEAGEFFSELLREVGALFDDPSSDSLIDLVYQWQLRAYQPSSESKRPYVYEDRPFQTLGKPLAETTLGLVTSSGHFAAADPPTRPQGDVDQAEAISLIGEFLRETPQLSEIPTDVSAENLEVLHPGYDIRSVLNDPGVALPLTPLADAAKEGRIGRLCSPSYSFVGACSQGRLRKELDDWISRWTAAGVEALFLVPV